MNPPTCSSDKTPSSGRRQYKGALLHYSVKMHNSSYKYNNMDIMASMMLTYSWLKFIDMLLFVVTCIQTSNIEVFVPEGSSHFPHRAHQYMAQELEPFGSNTTIIMSIYI